MFTILVTTKAGGTFTLKTGFSTRYAAATYAAAALRGELCCRKPSLRGYIIVNAADARTTRESNDAAWAGRC
jgi:hypothetical protein